MGKFISINGRKFGTVTPTSANQQKYHNTSSGLTATTVQEAIDELTEQVQGIMVNVSHDNWVGTQDGMYENIVTCKGINVDNTLDVFLYNDGTLTDELKEYYDESVIQIRTEEHAVVLTALEPCDVDFVIMLKGITRIDENVITSYDDMKETCDNLLEQIQGVILEVNPDEWVSQEDGTCINTIHVEGLKEDTIAEIYLYDEENTSDVVNIFYDEKITEIEIQENSIVITAVDQCEEVFMIVLKALLNVTIVDINEQMLSSHNTSNDSHNDIRLLITELTNRLNTLADSDDITLDQMSELVTYIKNNKSLIDSITTNKVNVSDIIDNLTTNVSNKTLSAKQGVVLKGLIDTLQNTLTNIPTMDIKDTKTTFTSNDSKTVSSYTDVDVIASGEKTSSIFNKLSTMFKNIRYLAKMMGTTDISKIGDGTVTNAISTINSDLGKKSPIGHAHDAYYDKMSSREKNTILASPNGTNGVAIFRKLELEDLPEDLISQINDKEDNITGAVSTLLSSNLNPNIVPISNANGKLISSNITTTELGCLDGVTSNVQTQINNLNSDLEVKDVTLTGTSSSGWTTTSWEAKKIGNIVIATGFFTLKYANGHPSGEHWTTGVNGVKPLITVHQTSDFGVGYSVSIKIEPSGKITISNRGSNTIPNDSSFAVTFVIPV